MGNKWMCYYCYYYLFTKSGWDKWVQKLALLRKRIHTVDFFLHNFAHSVHTSLKLPFLLLPINWPSFEEKVCTTVHKSIFERAKLALHLTKQLGIMNGGHTDGWIIF